MKKHYLVLMAALSVSGALAQTHFHPLRATGSGGGRSTGGSFTLSSSIGQTAAIRSSSPTRGLQAGYLGALRIRTATLRTVEGCKFHDINGNGVFDPTDTVLSGWKVYLKNASGIVLDSASTDIQGNFRLLNVSDGAYILAEGDRESWIQTYPGTGIYAITMFHGVMAGARNFGNTMGTSFTGGSGASWSTPSNWAGNEVPGAETPAIIPPGVIVNVDALPFDSIKALKIGPGASLGFSNNVGQLIIAGMAQVDEGATLSFPSTNDTAGLVLYGSLVNSGTFDPGHSTITFKGNNPKSIANAGPSGNPDRNIFYDLRVQGENTTTSGNVVVQHTFTIDNSLTPRKDDTLKIVSATVNAIQGSGIISRGTVVRSLSSGETGNYRFESPSTYLKFNGAGTYPANVAMTATPGAGDPSFNLNWKVVGGTQDTANNIITFDSAVHFSKWAFGKPKITSSAIGTPSVERSYVISATGGSGFLAEMQLRYDQSEVPSGLVETGLQLLQGPIITDSVTQGWNMVSLPGVPEETLKTSLYPTSASAAFAFNGSYRQAASMSFGTGYWLKYTSSQPISVVARDVAEFIVPVRAGWNMIGGLSYPAPVTAVKPVSPVTLVSKLFGYSAGSGYSEAIMLIPGKAYWVKVSSAGFLNLSAESAAPPASVGMLSDARREEERGIPAPQLRRIEFMDAGGSSRELRFGVSGSEMNLSAYELPPIPPAGTFDARFSTGRNVEILTRGISKEIPIQISATHYPVTIRWSGQPDVTSALVLNGKAFALRSSGRVQLQNEESRVMLRLSPDQSPEIPEEYAIDQNYPNPFNPSTTIRYRLPVASNVTLRIYNVLGQVVQTLFDGLENEGIKSLDWDASSFGSGTYFCRFTAVSTADPSNSFTFVRKMVLVK